jgi:Domain of unknown function (DUF4365)
MKRPRSHVIDLEAMCVLKSTLPSWVPNELHPDYGKDFLFEVAEDQELTGFTFFVQLKGQQAVRLINGGASATFPLKKKDAIYYADKVRQPIFLVLVDVSRKVGYWLFLQKHLLDDWPNQNWRFQKTVNVQLPTTNTLTGVESLRAAVKQANDYMAARHPAAITSAIRAERERLEKLDPRMEVRIAATEQGGQITVVPKSAPVAFSIVFKGDSEHAAAKLDDLVGRGRPLTFQPGEIEVHGSPLFAEALKAGGTLVSLMRVPAAVSFVARDAAGAATGGLDGITGHIAGGPKECRFEGSLGDSPVNLSITAGPGEVKGDLRFGFHTPRWHGQPVGLLAYFPQIESFFNAAKRCAALDIRCSLQGNDFFSGAIPSDSIGFLPAAATFIDLLAKARELARHFGVNPALPSDFGPANGQEVEQLYRLVKEGELRRKLPGARITMHFSRVVARRLLEASAAADVPLEIHSIDDQRRPFLGIDVQVGRVKQIFTHTRISTRRATLKRRIESIQSGDCKVEFTCSQQCEMVVQLMRDEAARFPEGSAEQQGGPS